MKNKRRIATAALFVLIVVTWASISSAQWAYNGTPVNTIVGIQQDPVIVSDGAGGTIIVWRDYRSGSHADIYAQRIDRSGRALWAADGVPICTAAGDQYRPAALSDDAGGVIVAWMDSRFSSLDIYASRLDASGNALWTTDGVAVCTAFDSQYDPVIAYDTDGGAIIAWYDYRNSGHDVYAQRVNPSGGMVWINDGIAVCTETGYQGGTVITSDDSGGAIIMWEDARSGSGSDIYASRIDDSGIELWTSMVNEAANEQIYPLVAYDGAGGAVCVWSDYRSGTHYDVYAQRVDPNGSPIWAADGVNLCVNSYNKDNAEIVSDGSGGAIVMWAELRNQADYDVYAQRVNASGSRLWGSYGLPVCTESGNQSISTMTPGSSGGAIAVWTDRRAGNHDIYAQRLDGAGNAQWTAGGLRVCSDTNSQHLPSIVPDGNGGAFITWSDGRGASGSDIYAQAIDAAGDWGYPSPEVRSVLDVPGDQGGWVNFAWYGSRYDTDPNEEITQYTIWRALSPSQVATMMAAGATITDAPSSGLTDNKDSVVRKERVGAQTWFWELIDSHDTYRLEAYSKVVPTLFDSSSVTTEYHYYQVIAHTSDPYVFWISDPDSGYSVDNLPPAAPQALAGHPSMLPEGLKLTWRPNSDADLANYHVYRETSEDFTPGPENLIASPTDTLLFDPGWRWDSNFWYKVAAVDRHDNESPFATLGPDGVTGVDNAVPQETYLSQNYPNPFNPTTTIAFGLKEPADVTVQIYDASGRLVRTVADRHYAAGRHQTTWDGRDDAGARVASGVYFCQLDNGRSAFRRKIVLLK